MSNHPIFKLASREFRIIMADSRLRSVVLIAPFLYAALFAWIYSNRTVENIPIALVQGDFDSAGRTLTRFFNSSPKLKITENPTSPAEAKALLDQGTVEAAIIIPEDFSTRLKLGRDVAVTAYLNASSMVTANIAGKAINEIVQTFSAGVEMKSLMKKGSSSDMAREQFMPVKLDLRSLYNPGYDYLVFMVPGIMMAVLQQVILMALALTWTSEKEAKTLGEVLAITKNPWFVMIGKALPYTLINIVVAEVFLRIVFPLAGIPMNGSWYTVIPFTILFILAIVTWGLWASALAKTRLFATQALMFIALPSFVLSGFTYPQSAMPAALQVISHLLPITYFLHGFRRIYLSGGGAHVVAKEFLALSIFCIVNIIFAWMATRRVIDKIHSQSA